MALQLVVVEGPDLGRSFDVRGDSVVGRDPTASVQLNDDEVSRRHAIVTPAAGGASVEDLGSSNGTFVESERVDGMAAMAMGQHLRVGTTVLELREGQSTDEQPAVAREAQDPPSTKVPLPDWRTGAQ